MVSAGDGERQGYRLHSFLHFVSSHPGQARAESVWVCLNLHRQTLPFPPATLQEQKGLLLDLRLDVGRGLVGQKSPGYVVHMAPSASPR